MHDSTTRKFTPRVGVSQRGDLCVRFVFFVTRRERRVDVREEVKKSEQRELPLVWRLWTSELALATREEPQRGALKPRNFSHNFSKLRTLSNPNLFSFLFTSTVPVVYSINLKYQVTTTWEPQSYSYTACFSFGSGFPPESLPAHVPVLLVT